MRLLTDAVAAHDMFSRRSALSARGVQTRLAVVGARAGHGQGLAHDRAAAAKQLQVGHAAAAQRMGAGRSGGKGAQRGW